MPNWNDPGVVWNGGGLIWPFFSPNAGQKSVILSEIHVTLLRAGRDPIPLEKNISDIEWSSNAIGGFGSCTFTLPGIWRRRTVDYEDLIRVTYGPTILFEGVIEDLGLTLTDSGDIATAVQAFGLARYLDYYAVRRIWSKRDLSWAQYPAALGQAIGNSFTAADLTVSTGNYLPTDLSKSGVQVAGNAVAAAHLAAGAALLILPNGLAITRFMADAVLSGTNTGAGKMVGNVSFYNGSTWGSALDITASGAINQAVAGSCSQIQAALYNANAGALTPGPLDVFQLSNIRVLGTALTEDAPGGFYGGTILRDLIALAPGLQLGHIEDGSDFTIQSIERAVRDTMRSVVNEVAGYYAREWGVWESGRFDWDTPNLDEPQWVVKLSDVQSLDIRGTTDGSEAASYVLYTDAASGLDAEASVVSNDQRNPFVKRGIAQAGLTKPGFPMTSNTSAQLAAKLSSDLGKWPPVTGTITLPILAPVTHATGPTRPAFLIRGGDNIRIADLPKSDFITPGRDGETFFHISSVDVNQTQGTVTLTLEGQTRATDLLLARLAAVTRTLTG